MLVNYPVPIYEVELDENKKPVVLDNGRYKARLDEKGNPIQSKDSNGNLRYDYIQKPLFDSSIVIDENNELEKGGENVTAERQLNRVFSDVQAARYVHRICCSTKDTIDPNADIMLSIIAIDHKHKNLKNKLKEAGCSDYIKTVYGLGYKWQND